MTWPSFLAAAIRSGVTGSAGGTSAMTRVESAAPVSVATDPIKTSRREILKIFPGFFIGSFRPPVPGHLVHRELSFIPATRLESIVDRLLSEPLDLIAGFRHH